MAVTFSVRRPADAQETPSLLDARFERDSCGVGFVASRHNQPSSTLR